MLVLRDPGVSVWENLGEVEIVCLGEQVLWLYPLVVRVGLVVEVDYLMPLGLLLVILVSGLVSGLEVQKMTNLLQLMVVLLVQMHRRMMDQYVLDFVQHQEEEV